MARTRVEDLMPEDLPDAEAALAPPPEFASAPEKQFTAAPEPAPEPSPWNPDMGTAPRNGTVILVTESLAAPDGVKAIWYRALGQGRPWLAPPEGWMDPLHRIWLTFQPVGWAHVPADVWRTTGG
jgi:hypothetical protein